MKFGAIDIGSNAARLLVGEVVHEGAHAFVKKISYTRIPLRLGEEVFVDGKISKKKAEHFVKTIQAFKLISDIFEVKELRAVATSAMRDAENGRKIIAEVKQNAGVDIEIISGDEEAFLIFESFFLLNFDKEKPFLVVDVGGGSTEISVFENGEKVAAKSFQIGTLRILKGKVQKEDWTEMNKWVLKNVDATTLHSIFGTGGNINSAHKILGGKHMKPISINKLQKFHDELVKLNLEEREEQFQMKEDRADVIVPALDIFLFIMEALNSKEIIVPKIGLSDGMIYNMDKKHRKLNKKTD
ncbi:MAG: exopolyphosphatase [Bacteroidota bacterium]